jgi:S1-C subfamily serine protease
MKKDYLFTLAQYLLCILIGGAQISLSAQKPQLVPLSELQYMTADKSLITHTDGRNPCKVFIGVGTDSSPDGLVVDYTVENTPATQNDIKKGDIILKIDGIIVTTQDELIRQRDTHQPGDAFTLTVLQDGKERLINARFKSCTEAEKEAFRIAEQQKREFRLEKWAENSKEWQCSRERAILGVYEDDAVNVDGLPIGSVIAGKGAAAAGLQKGDIVVEVDGQKVTGSYTLQKAIKTKKEGDQVTVRYSRDGQTKQTKLILSNDRYVDHGADRDPCAVFIGINSSTVGNGERGSRISSIIDDTPAKDSQLQPGDIVLEMDGVAINSHTELLAQRNTHQPGDPFTLTILRDGSTISVNSQFRNCDATKKEEVVAIRTENPAIEKNNTLSLTRLSVFPNPTFGPLNIQFEAEAIPTKVTISDINGRVVYVRDLLKFNGAFNEQTEINTAAGTYTLTIAQGGKQVSKAIIVMPRA